MHNQKMIVGWFIAFALLSACTPLAAPSVTPTAPPPSASQVTPSIASTLPSPTVKPSSTPAQRPNIIFILTDDLDVASVAYMPKLQELVIKPGVTFSNFFVNVSLCCPSRSAISRGQYAQNTKIISNKPPNGGYEIFHANGDEDSTIAVWLQTAGYRTMHAGKYLNGYPNSVSKSFIPPGWTEWYSAIRGTPYNEYNYTLNENGQLVDYGNKPEDYGTDVYGKKAIDFIQRSAQAGVPFFASINPYAPHGPATPAPRHVSLFLDVRLPRPPNFNEADVSDKPSAINNRPLLTDKQIGNIEEQYRKRLQSLQAVDEMIENLVATLKKVGQLDNTYIFFTSDNGFHLGNHRLDLGKLAPYEEEARVPMFVRGPGVPAGTRLDHLTGNIDFAPTWAELGNAKTPSFVDGRSLIPLLKANPLAIKDWRQCYLFQRGDAEDPNPNDETGFDLRPPDMAGLLEPLDRLPVDIVEIGLNRAIPPTNFQGLRIQNYTYIEYANGELELYDLRADPYQLNNIVKTANPEMLKELSGRLSELAQCSGAQCRASDGKPFTTIK